MKKIFFTLIITAIILLTSCSKNNNDTTLLHTALDSYFNDRYGNVDNAPGAAILITKGDSVLYESYRGVADLSTQRKIDKNSRFCIASVSKQFTVVGLLKLNEKFPLMDSAMAAFFPEYTADFWKKVTPAHLASQSSGIPDSRDRSSREACIYANDSTSRIFFSDVKATIFEPGTEYDYVNPTFILLADIIERTTGKKFTDYQQSEIFDKAGMDHTYYFDPGSINPEAAHAYQPDGKGGWKINEYGQETFFATRPDGGIYSTVRDLAKWEKALRDTTIINGTSRELAYTPHVDVAASTRCDYQRRPNTWYGLGWFIETNPGKPRKVYHTGDNGGFQAYLCKYPETDVNIIVLENRHDLDRWKMATDVEQILTDNGILK